MRSHTKLIELHAARERGAGCVRAGIWVCKERSLAIREGEEGDCARARVCARGCALPR